MFNKNKSRNSSRKSNNAMGAASSNNIGQDTEVEGTITAKHDLRIDGLVNGTLNCQGRIIIGELGHVHGIVHCQNALIEGRLIGHITVMDTLHITKTAHVEGEVKTQQLSIDSGAFFNVSCDMPEASTAETLELKETLKIETAV